MGHAQIVESGLRLWKLQYVFHSLEALRMGPGRQDPVIETFRLAIARASDLIREQAEAEENHDYELACTYIERRLQISPASQALRDLLRKYRIRVMKSNAIFDHLGIPRNARKEDVRRMKLRWNRVLHPDKNGDLNETQRKYTEEILKKKNGMFNDLCRLKGWD